MIETLEDFAEKWVFETNGHKWSNNDDTAGDNYGSFIAGFKEAEKRLYSEEDLRKAFRDGENNKYLLQNTNNEYAEIELKSDLTENQWFEQFKKK